MATVRDVIAYVCTHYPYKDDLSKARLAKMVYLADWRSAIVRGMQITDIIWRFNYYGPYVEDVVDEARIDPAFEVQPTVSYYGDFKEVVRVRGNVSYPSLNKEEREILDFVIASVASKNWTEFKRLVYSTYPIVTQPRFATLDLVELAAKYKQEQAVSHADHGAI